MIKTKNNKRAPDYPEVLKSGVVHRTYIKGVLLDKQGKEAAQTQAVKYLGKTLNDIVWTDFALLNSEPCVVVDVLINE